MITIGVPARNEERTIEKTVESLREQKLPENTRHEIIVCVNDSTDKTAEIVRRIASEDKRVRVIEAKDTGKSNALNLIAENVHKNSDILVFTDADAVLGNEAVAKLVDCLDAEQQLQAVSAVPAFEEREGRNLVERMAIAQAKTWTAKHLCGALLAIRKKAYAKIPKDIGSDDVWLSLAIGLDRIKLLPEVKVLVSAPTNLRDFINQRIRWHVGQMQMEQTEKGSKITPELFSKERFRKILRLSNFEKLLLAPALLIRFYTKFAARKALREGKFQGGWAPPKRA